MHVRFVLVSPASKIRERAVGLPVVVGRGPEAGLRITQESVSRRHCEIFEKSGTVFLRDLGSTNGTLVGGAQISTSAAVALEPGTEVRVGDARFRIEFEQTAVVRQPATAAPTLTGAEDDLDIPDLTPPDLTPPDTEPQRHAAPLPAAPVAARAKPTAPAASGPTPAAAPAGTSAEPALPAAPPARSVAPPAEPPAFPAEAAASDEPPLIDAGGLAAADESPADAFSFPGPDVVAAEPPASFDFLAPEAAPQPTDDASLDDFLKGLQ